MRQIVGVIGAVLVAAFVPAIYFGVPDQSFRGGVIAFVLALLWIVLLGLPAFLLLKHRGLVRWWSATISGFFLAALPMAFISWPYHPSVDSGYSAWDGHKMVNYVVHGVPTHDGWVQYFYSSCGIGLMGAASAVAFWVVWRLAAGPNQSSKRTRVPRAT
ncbi:hypothetical protein ABQJ54_13095 [Rhodanobacter sp. Si-c]|uniref:DUF4175 domain-containing protein n=1 Tax=Rhodanobacter lycopersici TaxID=3162487 RepID=A0ABV3QGM6_9GAMM